MSPARYGFVPRDLWNYIGPAFRGIDADLTALEATATSQPQPATASSPAADVRPYLPTPTTAPYGIIRTINRINFGGTATQATWSDPTLLKLIIQNPDPTNNLLVGYGTYGNANPPATTDTVPPGQEWVGSASALPLFVKASAASIDAIVITYRSA